MDVLTDYPEYLIDRQGRIFSNISGKFLSTRGRSMGYPSVSLVGLSGKETVKVHRLLAKTYLSNPKNLKEVNHIDGNKENNCLSNLEWVAGFENVRHAFSNMLCSKSASIPYTDIPKIIESLRNGETWTTIGETYHTSCPSTIRKLIRRAFVREGKLTEFEELTKQVRNQVTRQQSQRIQSLSLDGEITEYASMQEAGRQLNVNAASLHKAITHGKPYKDLVWSRVDD